MSHYCCKRCGLRYDDCGCDFSAPNGGVAQLVEHRTENPGVVGSNPTPATKRKPKVIIREFVEKYQIGCADAIYQRDIIAENALQLIEELINCVGYYKEDADDGS